MNNVPDIVYIIHKNAAIHYYSLQSTKLITLSLFYSIKKGGEKNNYLE